jgi:hypothetical protein
MPQSPTEALKEFLKSTIPSKDYDNLIDNTDEENELHTFINDNFDYFGEDLLRKLVKQALITRDANTNPDGTCKVADSDIMGIWSTMIDAVREVTATRQEQAGEIFKKVVHTAQTEGPRLTATLISRIYRSGQIDNLFQELLSGAIESCEQQQNKDGLEMFKFFQKVIDQNKAVEVARSHQNSQSATKKENDSDPLSLNEQSSSTAAPMPPAPPAEVRAVPKNTARVATDMSSSADRSDDKEDDVQNSLIAASQYLKKVIDESKGDAAALQKRIQTDLWSVMTSSKSAPALDFDIDHFTQVVTDNTNASKQAGYVNRVKLLQFIENRVLKPLRVKILENYKNQENTNGADDHSDGLSDGSGEVPGTDASVDNSTNFHAPKFMDDESMRAYKKSIIAPMAFTPGFAKDSTYGKQLSKTGQLIKSKAAANPQVSLRELASTMGSHMTEHGWAVCDHFISADLVRRVRIEAGLFEEHYEQSEIWVGKNADVGTLLSVPSVRGDKVIWMCGGHDSRTAPEGVSRKVKTKGDIEPCRLEAKARAPMRKFSALKEAIKACDALVDEMKTIVPAMEKIYSRSDAMLANYPGGGSRFARHIDNTTNDGRRITLLIYLNPEWNIEVDQGALRLTPQNSDIGVDVYPECGRLAMFYSADMPHEVLPTYGDRHAITVWYYDQIEREQAIASAKDSGAAQAAVNAGTDAQREAKEFISDLMGGDEVDEDGGDPSKEELQALCNKVVDLSDNTLGVVASITGAPSTSSFRAGFPMLTPADLKQMRQLFRRMGLGPEVI